MNTIFPKVAAFSVQLEKLNIDFVGTSQIPYTSASVSFLGLFQGQTVLWNMTLTTLSHFQSNVSKNISATQSGLSNRPFIEIHDGNEGVFKILVSLDIELIDEPAIIKTIIMIRNYKRLAVGRIAFGSMHA